GGLPLRFHPFDVRRLRKRPPVGYSWLHGCYRLAGTGFGTPRRWVLRDASHHKTTGGWEGWKL
ncbi:MAG: hypothetical protein MUC60_09810, partial [Oscillatoria sp. Prado101]|nr:hypothetical protein [Oscillatoria sp. Prado101]